MQVSHSEPLLSDCYDVDGVLAPSGASAGSVGLSQRALEGVRTMIGRLHHVVIDCPDPASLAAFYSELLGLPVTYRSDDWVVIAQNDTTSGIAFQRALDHQPPQWPNPHRPQQFHLDVMVDDVDAAEPRVLGLGARRLSSEEGGSRVYADPVGHPFCLVPRPAWAPPIHVR